MSHPPIVEGSKFFSHDGTRFLTSVDDGMLTFTSIESLVSSLGWYWRPIIAAVAAQEWRDEERKCNFKTQAGIHQMDVCLRNADAWISWRAEPQAAHD